MTVFAGGKVEVGQPLDTQFAMHARGLYLNDVLVAGRTVDRVQATAVAPAVRTDMTIEAFRLCMWCDREIRKVVVALDARVGFFRRARPGGEHQADNEDGE